MVKFKIASLDVPEFVTEPIVPAAPTVTTGFTPIVAALPRSALKNEASFVMVFKSPFASTIPLSFAISRADLALGSVRSSA